MNRSPRHLAALVAAGILLGIGAPAALATEIPASTATGSVALTDRFETGLGNWRLVMDGAGTISRDRGKSGRGMYIRVPADGASRAYARYELSDGTYGIVASAWFRVISADCDRSAGWSQGNIPFFRLFDASGRRIAGVFAAKTPCGTSRRPVFVQHSYENYFPTSGRIALRAWNRVVFSVQVQSPGRSLVQVLLNGKRIYRTTTAMTGLDRIAAVQLGNEHVGQSGRFVVDDVKLSRLAATPPAADTCTPGTATPAATVTTGTPTLASAFEDRTAGDWTVRLAGTGSVTIASSYAHDGTCAAHLRSDRGALTRAMLWATLPAGATDVSAEGWFLVQREGAARSNVPFFRILRGTTRMVDVYRQNGTGALWLAVPGQRPLKLGVAVPLGEWHQVAVHANATTGAVGVWLDGTLATTAGTTFTLGTSPFTRVILGNETASQVFDLWVDSVVVSTGAGG